MSSFKNILLPLAAVILTGIGIGYTACQKNVATKEVTTGAQQIRTSLKQLEETLITMKALHEKQVDAYAQDMGCTSESIELIIVRKRDSLLTSYDQRLKFHQLEFLQSDTTDTLHNSRQLLQLEVELVKAKQDLEAMRTDSVSYNAAHFKH